MIDYSLNYENIDSLVRNHFSLDEKSQEEFSVKIKKGTSVDEEIINRLDENFRIERNLSILDLEELDISWKLFKYYFGEYCFDKQITYSEFLLNSRVNQKNISKLTKDVRQYYSSGGTAYTLKNNEYDLEMQLTKINNLRLPRKKLKIVLSFNLSDMFMCSSGQDWTSCLNLESEYFGCYWLGLASLPFDRNRCMVYIAPQNPKEPMNVFDVQTERMFRRTFGLLDENDNINILKWYPIGFESDFYIPVLNRLFSSFAFQEISEDFVAKHEPKLPTLKRAKRGEKISFYIYQDKTYLNENHEIKFSFEKGNQSFNEFNVENFGPFVTCQGGLKRIKSLGSEVVNYIGKHITCCGCEERIHEEDVMYYDDCPYCSRCYEDVVCEEEDEEASW